MTWPVKTTPIAPATSAPMQFHPTCLKPQFFPDLLDSVANGELLIDFCKRLDIKYSDVLGYITGDSVRMAAWGAAVKDGQSWLVNRIISELKAMAHIDIKDALDSSGCVRRIEDIPETLRRAITGMEVKETFELVNGKQVWNGYIKTIKLADKHKSAEMLGKQLNMFVDKVVVSGSVEVKHHVEKYDLEERISMLRAGKVPRETVASAQSAESVEEAIVVSRGGEDI